MILDLAARSGERLANQMVADSIKVHVLRRDLAEANLKAQETIVKGAEMEAPLKALNEFTDYLLERTREERNAHSETGLWTRGSMGNSIALTVYQDLCTKLDKVRTSYGL